MNDVMQEPTISGPDVILECRAVGKVYQDAGRVLEILKGVSLCVPRGKIMAISGPSGAGKSTLLHIMGTLDRPTSGEVFFNGVSYAAMSRRDINRLRNRHIGFVFQFYHLLPEFTAMENVMMPALCAGASRRTCHDRAEELLVKVGLQDRMHHKPGKLSGGEQQRVAIARALFNRPALALCDEPTGNLDERTGTDIIALLFDLNRLENTTFVLVTHDEHLAERADCWVALRAGQAEIRRV